MSFERPEPDRVSNLLDVVDGLRIANREKVRLIDGLHAEVSTLRADLAALEKHDKRVVADLAAANETIAALRAERDKALKELALQRYFDPAQYREGI
jgi:outer membrane murein-binding lipoprotein Lpp